MAELAVGLSKSVLVGAITKVQSAIDEDSKLRQKAQGDLVSISLELEMMQAFLDDANEEMKNNLVKTWVKHVRQLAYDVEDCVENVVHLDDKPIFWRRLLPSFIAPVLPLDLAVEELGKLKGRVEDVNNCYRRYSKINDTTPVSKLAAAVMQQQPRRLPPGAFQILAEARGATKRQHGVFGNLTQLITKTERDNPDTQVISVWGTDGDHGTTSIIRGTFNDPEICKNFTNRSWVKLMHPFNPHDFIRSMMEQFYANSCSDTILGIHVLAKMDVTQEHLFKEFEKLVIEERYLVVLEGPSNMVEWDFIRTFLPTTHRGSCIIVSTQQAEIATLCVGQLYEIVELTKISDDHSVCAVFKVDSQVSKGDAKGDANTLKKLKKLNSLKKSKGYDDYEGYIQIRSSGLLSRLNELSIYPIKARFNSPPVMSVLGIAGIGKTAVVRSLLNSDHNYYDKCYWLDVSHPFNMRDVYLTLLSDFHSTREPIEECHNLLQTKNCLIVIDDLRSTRDWDLMQAALVTKHSKSVIIVITSDASIATYCTNNEDLIFNVKALRVDEAVYLFKTQVRQKNPSSRLMFQDVEVQELISKCGGIPKVIVAIAGLLATRKGKSMDTVRSLNHRFMHHLETNPEYASLQDLFGWMHSMVLNPPAFLKPCIFYLSIFPRGHIIRRRRLVRRWIAEGYSRESVEMQAEEIGEMFFSELLELSIFQQIQLADTSTLNDTRMVVYQVNGFIREYIMSRQIEENIVFELGASSAPLTTQNTGRHLIILKGWKRDRIVFESIDLSRLRSLTVFGQWESFFISKSMNLLRVLDLEDASGVTDGDLEKMVNLFQRLKFLSLRGQRDICHLPTSLGDLRQLQTLDVRGTSIITIPYNISKLKKLQYIRAGTNNIPGSIPPASSSWLPNFRKHHCCQVGVVMPRGTGNLTMLHTLGVVNIVGSGGKAILDELKKVTQLRKLGVSGVNMKNINDFVSAISGHVYLESFSVHLDKYHESCLNDISLPCENLKSLKLYGLDDKLPLSRGHFTKLGKLDLEMVNLGKVDIEFLGMLPELCILRLCVNQLQNGKLHFCAKMYGVHLVTFKKVKILEIACKSRQLQVTFGSKSMKNLELLKIDCSSASYQLTGLNDLSELKQVLLKGTNDETSKIQLESQLVHHPKRPEVKLEELPNLS